MNGRLWAVGDRVALRVVTGTVAYVGSGGDTRVEFDDGGGSWVDENYLEASTS